MITDTERLDFLISVGFRVFYSQPLCADEAGWNVLKLDLQPVEEIVYLNARDAIDAAMFETRWIVKPVSI